MVTLLADEFFFFYVIGHRFVLPYVQLQDIKFFQQGLLSASFHGTTAASG
jgi:hypothetical protein